jgi:hypothetical protein
MRSAWVPTNVGDRATPGFGWQDARYAASEVFATWHLQDRWWEQTANPSTATYSLRRGAQDRTSYCVYYHGPAGDQVFDLYRTR